VTLVLLLLALAVVAGVAAVAAGIVAGGLDDPTTTVPPRELPPGRPRGADVAALRFVPALRGYRMDQVDAAMDRLGEEIERLHAELADRDRRLAGPTERPATEFDPTPQTRTDADADTGDGEPDPGAAGTPQPRPWGNPEPAPRSAPASAGREPGDPTGGTV
jgi:DivIVA domain-containing protein